MRTYAVLFICSFLATTAQAGERPLSLDPDDLQVAELERLDQAILLYASPDASDRLAAVQQFAHQAGGRAELERHLERLLLKATADSDSEVAWLATQTLKRRRRPLEAEPPSDRELSQGTQQQRVRWAREALSRPASVPGSKSDRLAAAHVLIYQLLKGSNDDVGAAWLLADVRHGPNREIAHLVETALSRYEGRGVDPRFALALVPSQEGPNERSARDLRAEAIYATLEDPNPTVRLTGLHWVLDVALDEGTDSDPRIRQAFDTHREDPDLQVGSFVQFAIAGLDGNEDSLRQVLVGQVAR